VPGVSNEAKACCFAFLTLVIPTRLFAKGDISKITIEGADLKTPIEIIDFRDFKGVDYSPWSGPGVSVNGKAQTEGREDYVEEAWRIVDPALKAKTPVFEYEPGTWGPKEAAQVAPPGGWNDPVLSTTVARIPEVVRTKEGPKRRKAG